MDTNAVIEFLGGALPASGSKFTLVTRNTADFQKVTGLACVDAYEQ